MCLSNKIIYLKKLTLKYSSNFKSLFNDPDLCRYLSIPYPINNLWIKDYISEAMEKFNTEEKYTWGIFRHSLDDLIGVAVIKDIDLKNRSARIGYSTGKKYWNNGYTIMAVRIMLDYAYKELNLNRIEVRIDTDDAKSVKLLKEIGGVKEGLLRQAACYNNEFKDIELYSIIKSEYYKS